MKLALALCGLGTSVAHADATLVYQLTGPGGEPTEKQLSISRFFVRVDDSADKEHYLLFQAGKFFPLYRVDESQQTYALLTPPVEPTLHAGSTATAKNPAATKAPEVKGEPDGVETPQATEEHSPATTTWERPATQQADHDAAQPREPAVAADKPDLANSETADLAPSPKLKPTRKTRSVAGIECRTVFELVAGKPIIEHCMANKARLGITERESRTLARLFVLAREKGFDWLGAATVDEEFVSVQSRDLRRQKTLVLKSLSTDSLPVGYLRVPRTFKEIAPTKDVKRPAEGTGVEANPPQPTPAQGDDK